MSHPQNERSWLNRPIFPSIPFLNAEVLLFAMIIALMAVSRLYDLGARIMSHDESLHVYYSWLYSVGKGYQHTPTTHGPLQFHILALTYFFFGDNDFTARLPYALANILTVVALWNWKRYLGRAGMLVAAALVLISPFMLYYGRYARNETYVALLGVLLLYALLRYLETGRNCYLLLLTIVTVLHFTVKETAFIYTAQAMLFLAFYLISRVLHSHWKDVRFTRSFIVTLCVGTIFIVAALVFNQMIPPTQGVNDASQTSAPLVPGGIPLVTTQLQNFPLIPVILFFGILSFIAAAILLIIGIGWKNLRMERSFDMLILLGTFVLPQLAPLPVKALGWNPLDYAFSWPGWNWGALWAQGPVKTASIMFVLIILAFVFGLLWDWKRWLINTAVFWGIYIFFYSSIFTNWAGLATGVVGSLGYWLEQQGVQRGGQPWYYYLLIQIPLYEFLPALGLALAVFFGVRKKSPSSGIAPEISSEHPISTPPAVIPAPVFPLLIWWALSSLLAFSMAGEKMPWLTVHITLPMILLTGWGLGQVIERLDWKKYLERGGWITILMIFIFISFIGIFIVGMGTTPPFQGKSLEQLSTTGMFLFSLITVFFSLAGLLILVKGWTYRNVIRLATLIMFTLLALLTGRTAVRAAFLHPNDATEYLVYAHGASWNRRCNATNLENLCSDNRWNESFAGIR